MKEDDIFIQLLEYGVEVGIEGTSSEEMIYWARERGLIVDYRKFEKDSEEWVKGIRKERLLNRLFEESFIQTRIPSHGTGHVRHTLSGEYRSRLLEYYELQEARKASKDANRNSMFAIGIAIISLIVSIGASVINMYKPMDVNQNQINQVVSEFKSLKKCMVKVHEGN